MCKANRFVDATRHGRGETEWEASCGVTPKFSLARNSTYYYIHVHTCTYMYIRSICSRSSDVIPLIFPEPNGGTMLLAEAHIAGMPMLHFQAKNIIENFTVVVASTVATPIAGDAGKTMRLEASLWNWQMYANVCKCLVGVDKQSTVNCLCLWVCDHQQCTADHLSGQTQRVFSRRLSRTSLIPLEWLPELWHFEDLQVLICYGLPITYRFVYLINIIYICGYMYV